jgi:hypothetical protein
MLAHEIDVLWVPTMVLVQKLSSVPKVTRRSTRPKGLDRPTTPWNGRVGRRFILEIFILAQIAGAQMLM